MVSSRYTRANFADKLTLLQLELLNTGLIGGYGGTLDTDTILLDSLGGINGDLVIGLVTILNAEVVVLKVDIEVRKNQLQATNQYRV